MSIMKQFVNDRNAALIKAIIEDDWQPVRAYCKKYGIEIPEDETIMKAGIYKAAQECTDIPQQVKIDAALKCLDLGFSPFIRPIEPEREGE